MGKRRFEGGNSGKHDDHERQLLLSLAGFIFNPADVLSFFNCNVVSLVIIRILGCIMGSKASRPCATYELDGRPNISGRFFVYLQRMYL
jgi:hypothetical protein